MRSYRNRNEVIAESITPAEAARALGITPTAVRDLIGTGDLVALKRGREWLIPAWQLNPDAPRGFVPGVARLGASFASGVVAMTLWATAPTVELGGRTPARALADGDVDAVVQVAGLMGPAGW